MGAARRSSPVKSPSTNGMRSLAIRLMPTRSLTALFTTPIASIWPAKVCDADVPDRSHRIDHQPANLSKIYYQQGARQPGDIISEPAGDILGICTFDRMVRCRTVAKVLSMGFVVRKCFQCSAGKS